VVITDHISFVLKLLLVLLLQLKGSIGRIFFTHIRQCTSLSYTKLLVLVCLWKITREWSRLLLFNSKVLILFDSTYLMNTNLKLTCKTEFDKVNKAVLHTWKLFWLLPISILFSHQQWEWKNSCRSCSSGNIGLERGSVLCRGPSVNLLFKWWPISSLKCILILILIPK
jgi:hypothetical protein